MATNALIYKVQPTLIINDVNNNLQNYEIDYNYETYSYQYNTIITGEILILSSPTTLQATIPFVELISDYPVDLSFMDDTSTVITSLKSVKYFAGNIKGYNFSLTNNQLQTTTIKWSIYY
jgi:hypothetical protein